MNSMLKKWNTFVEVLIDKGGYHDVLQGLENTLKIAVAGLLIGIVIGTLVAAVKVTPKYKRSVRVLQKICAGYVALFRGTPIVVQLLITHFVLFPLFGINVSSVGVCIIVFGFNSGAYISEIMRSGIGSVDAGQMEAGRALGLSFPVAMVRIIIPQAVKNILPTIGNEFIALIKETSVVSFVGAMDLSVAFRKIGSNSYEYMVPYIVMALIYIVLVALISLLVRFSERRLARSDRNR